MTHMTGAADRARIQIIGGGGVQVRRGFVLFFNYLRYIRCVELFSKFSKHVAGNCREL